MMYSNRFVAAIKVNGKVLREQNETVALPFGAEYSILLKNLSTVRALVKVSVDGQDATDSTWLIVPANGSIDLERFIRNGNWSKGNRFKFIERTSQIEEHRGVGAEDGLIRVEYKFEIPQTQTIWNQSLTWNSNLNSPDYTWESPDYDITFRSDTKSSGVKSRGLDGNGMCRSLNFVQSSTTSYTPDSSTLTSTAFNTCDLVAGSPQVNTAGITVAGSESNQKFVAGEWFSTEAVSHSIILKLVGAVQGVKVEQPVTVKVKPTCTTCGKVNKATNKFCGRCGTALQLF